MAKVISLYGGLPESSPPDQDVIEILEQLLAEAKDGTIRGICFATVERADIIATGWKGAVSYHMQVSASASLHFRLMSSYSDVPAPPVPAS